MPSCPTCGQPILDTPPNLPRLSPIQMALFRRLRRAGNHGVRSDALYVVIYNNHVRSSAAIKVHIYNLRKKLVGCGLRIESYGWGRTRDELATYRLIPE